MRLITASLFCFGVVVACVECAAPYFPWINLGGVAMMAVAAVIANRINWDEPHAMDQSQ
jgi:hypothetical protein